MQLLHFSWSKLALTCLAGAGSVALTSSEYDAKECGAKDIHDAQSLLQFRTRAEQGPLPGSWESKLDHGKMHGFPSYDEAVELLEGWLKEYPGLLRRREIGSSFQKRKIFAYNIRMHEGGPFKAPPQMLVTALMHAREPASLTVLLYFMGHLMELYHKGDPHAMHIIQTRELWLIPFVNPDGYIANEKNNMEDLRKNVRPTCGSSAVGGVDLNRNFGFHWSSSIQPCDEDYAGTKPFSEPETQALKGIIEKQKFVSAVNFHSFGGVLVHPYNYGIHKLPLDDQRIYEELADTFKWPESKDAAWYNFSGGSDDWMYAAHQIISMSPEVGPESGSFWPASTLIAGINERNFARTLAVTQKTGFELESSWTKRSLEEQKLPSDIRVGLKAAGGAARIALTLKIRNTGMAATVGKAITLAVSGATAPGRSPRKNSAFVRNLGIATGHLPIQLAGMDGHALALVFQTSTLKRRSVNNFDILLARSVASDDVIDSGVASDYLQVCVMEVPDQQITRAVCQCSKDGARTFAEAKTSGTVQEQLCSVAAAFIPG